MRLKSTLVPAVLGVLLSWSPGFAGQRIPVSAEEPAVVTPPLKFQLRIPAQHPYLALTPAEIEKAKSRAAEFAWAKQSLARCLSDADRAVARPWDKLPDKGAETHRALSSQLFRVALAYALSDQPRYAAWVRQGLLAYAELYPRLPLVRQRSRLFTQSSLYEATWLVPVVEAYDLIAGSDVLSAAERRQIENDLLRPAAACFRIEDFQRDPRIRDLHFRCYNFQAWHLAAVGLVGLAVRDPQLVEYAVNSPYGYCHLVAHDIREDGLFWERSLGYHHFVLQALTPWTEAMARCGVDLYHLRVPNDRRRDEDAHYVTDSTERPKSLKLLFDAPLYLAFPDLTYPALGDSNRGPLDGDWLRLIGYNRYRDTASGWLVRRSQPLSATRPPPWQWLIYDLPDDSVANVWPLGEGSFANTGQYAHGCSLFPSSGVAVLREAQGDFSARPESTAVSLSYGPYGGGHGHPDKLNIVLYAQGRQWLPDFGSMPYETSWKAQWTAHTISHNTLVVDEVSQSPAGTADKQWPVDSAAQRVLGRLEDFDSMDKRVRASCDSAYPGLRLTRQTRLVGHVVIDELDVRPSRPGDQAQRQFDYVLHLDGHYSDSTSELATRSGPLGRRCGYQHVAQQRAGMIPGAGQAFQPDKNVPCITFAAGQHRLAVWIVPLDHAPTEIIVADGLTNKPEQKQPMLILRRRASQTRFVTVLEPVRAEEPLQNVHLTAPQAGSGPALILRSSKGAREIALSGD